MSGKHEHFLARLRDAFPRVVIDAADAFRTWGKTYCDALAYANHLDGKCWDDLAPAYLDVRSDALGFLGTAHLVAVLPAYLELLVTGGPFTQTPYMLLLMLTPPRTGTSGTRLGRRRFTAMVDALSPAQKHVVAEALRAFAARYAGTPFETDAQIALEAHWSVAHDAVPRP